MPEPMTDTARRVNVTLTIPTDRGTTDVLTDILNALKDAPTWNNDLPPIPVESADVRAFTLTDDDEPEPCVQALVNPDRGHLSVVFVDEPERADHVARGTGCVVVELPITADHRRQEPTPDERLNDLAAEGFTVTPATPEHDQ
ncbi:hypothetical protein ACQEU3_47040 [Spirillospora sp. CA-253888]